MGLIGIGAKVGYAAGKHLPTAAKVVSVKAPAVANAAILKAQMLTYTLTPAKAMVFTWHVTVTTAKIVGAGVIGILGAHWAGF